MVMNSSTSPSSSVMVTTNESSPSKPLFGVYFQFPFLSIVTFPFLGCVVTFGVLSLGTLTLPPTGVCLGVFTSCFFGGDCSSFGVLGSSPGVTGGCSGFSSSESAGLSGSLGVVGGVLLSLGVLGGV
ncbi:hypothetical protein D3C77_523100 [compost metagenome]